nr:hypothetical protein [uncultured bacterium]
MINIYYQLIFVKMYNSWVEISQSAILHNLAQYKRIIGSKVAVMPIVKSNAYGHGMIEVAKLVAPKVKWLGVVNLAEALELRRNNIRKRIFVLSYVQPNLLEQGIKQTIELPVYGLQFAKEVSRVDRKLRKTAKIHIKIDTGTSRLGILAKDAINLIKKVNQLPNLKIEGIWSHFAASEENQKYTKFQLDQFNKILDKLDQSGIKIPYKHFACSAATLVNKDSHFNLIRLGISLYGLWPSEQIKKITLKEYYWFRLKPALIWKAKIIQVKEISKGIKVGYGCTYAAPKRIKMAVVAAGYWEGYDRHLSNPPTTSFRRAGKGEILVAGKRCPVIGRVCMNLTMVDVSKVKNVKSGEEVVLLGKQGREEVSVEELAEKIGAINYEVVDRINPLLQRIYLK